MNPIQVLKQIYSQLGQFDYITSDEKYNLLKIINKLEKNNRQPIEIIEEELSTTKTDLDNNKEENQNINNIDSNLEK